MAEVITLPVIRIERAPDGEPIVQMRLRGLIFRRLKKRAEEWNVSMDEAAAYLIEQSLAPKKK